MVCTIWRIIEELVYYDSSVLSRRALRKHTLLAIVPRIVVFFFAVLIGLYSEFYMLCNSQGLVWFFPFGWEET